MAQAITLESDPVASPAFWRGREAKSNPDKRRALFEPSEFRSHMIRYCGEGTRRAVHGQKWFWSLLPKQK